MRRACMLGTACAKGDASGSLRDLECPGEGARLNGCASFHLFHVPKPYAPSQAEATRGSSEAPLLRSIAFQRRECRRCVSKNSCMRPWWRPFSLLPARVDLELTCWVCGTNSSALERERARAHQIGEPELTETELALAPRFCPCMGRVIPARPPHSPWSDSEGANGSF